MTTLALNGFEIYCFIEKIQPALAEQFKPERHDAKFVDGTDEPRALLILLEKIKSAQAWLDGRHMRNEEFKTGLFEATTDLSVTDKELVILRNLAYGLKQEFSWVQCDFFNLLIEQLCKKLPDPYADRRRHLTLVS